MFSFYESLTAFSVSAVIIQSMKDMPPLTEDSIIFTADRQAVGKVSVLYAFQTETIGGS